MRRFRLHTDALTLVVALTALFILMLAWEYAERLIWID